MHIPEDPTVLTIHPIYPGATSNTVTANYLGIAHVSNSKMPKTVTHPAWMRPPEFR